MFEKGYYWVEHYNHAGKQIMYFNGNNFEGFKSDVFKHDEINLKTVKKIQESGEYKQ